MDLKTRTNYLHVLVPIGESSLLKELPDFTNAKMKVEIEKTNNTPFRSSFEPTCKTANGEFEVVSYKVDVKSLNNKGRIKAISIVTKHILTQKSARSVLWHSLEINTRKSELLNSETIQDGLNGGKIFIGYVSVAQLKK